MQEPSRSNSATAQLGNVFPPFVGPREARRCTDLVETKGKARTGCDRQAQKAGVLQALSYQHPRISLPPRHYNSGTADWKKGFRRYYWVIHLANPGDFYRPSLTVAPSRSPESNTEPRPPRVLSSFFDISSWNGKRHRSSYSQWVETATWGLRSPSTRAPSTSRLRFCQRHR